mgnify:CR=1 FL=1
MSSNAEQKPPLNWLPVIMFSVSTLILLTLVPLYGFFYGYNWIGGIYNVNNSETNSIMWNALINF